MSWFMTLEETLEQRIQQAVAEYLDAGVARANQAVQDAFARASKPRRGGIRAGRSIGKRRSSDELAQLGEKLVAAVAGTPGQGMTTLSTMLGVSAADLQAVVQRERREGRLRVVGKRRFARYFPTTGGGQDGAGC